MTIHSKKLHAALLCLAAVYTCGALAGAGGFDPAGGRALYQLACATCHGVDGQGAPPHQVGFDQPLPDFTDCSFATREPDADWLAVAHVGGPARAFVPLMPSFGEALTEEQLLAILGHVRTFCRSDAWPRGELNFPRALVTEKAFPEDEALWITSVATEGRGAVANRFIYEQRFGARHQFEVIVPTAWEERTLASGADDWTGGLGDVAVGTKHVLFHSLERGSIVSIAGEAILPTGDEDDGFGKGATILEPFVAYGQALPAGSFFQFQGGVELPLEGGLSDEAFARFVLGRTWNRNRFGRAFSPMVELVGARELTSGATDHWDVVPQVQVTLSTRQHVMANVGLRVPVNDTRGRDTQLMFYLLWDWFDGGIHEGW